VSFTVPTGITGVRKLTVFLTGDGGTDERTYSVVAPVEQTLLTVVGPNGGETYSVGDTLVVEWQTDSSVLTEVEVHLSINGARDWISLTGDKTVSAYDPGWPRYRWVIPTEVVDEGGTPVALHGSSDCLIRVAPYDNQTVEPDISDGPFGIGVTPDRVDQRPRAGGAYAARVPLRVYTLGGRRRPFTGHGQPRRELGLSAAGCYMLLPAGSRREAARTRTVIPVR
jgi:hypothetical protein